MLYALWVKTDRALDRTFIHLIDEDGALAHTAPTLGQALQWLWEKGEQEVVAMLEDGPELFLVEACEHPTLALPSASLRRHHAGGCSDPPALLGLGPDPTSKTQVIEDRALTLVERCRRFSLMARRMRAK